MENNTNSQNCASTNTVFTILKPPIVTVTPHHFTLFLRIKAVSYRFAQTCIAHALNTKKRPVNHYRPLLSLCHATALFCCRCFCCLGVLTAFTVVMQARTRWNQTTHNHVFFQAAQVVAFAHDGSFGQDTSGLLERCSRNE